MTAPPLTYVTRIALDVDPPLDLGAAPDRHRRLVPIRGGTVEGPLLNGRVLPAGVDAQTLRTATCTELDATYALETDAGARIAVHNVGLRVGSPDDIAALVAGRAVDPDRIYFRTTPRLSSADAELAWVNDSVFVATGARHELQVVLDVFRVG